MRSAPGFVDAEEDIRWIVEQARRVGRPISFDVVGTILQLELEFELLVGNAIRLDRLSEDPSILCTGDNLHAIRKNPVCRLCILESGITLPQEDEAGQTPD